ncbi:MAG: hypothetical protein U0359_01630 [Byssovorax sp.]
MTMRRFFGLIDGLYVPDRWHLGKVLAEDGAEPLFDDGAPCERSLLLAKVTHPGRALDFCVSAFNAPIARDSLAAAIVAVAGADLQSIPVLVGKESGFRVLNAVRVVRCIDEDRSEFGRWTEKDNRPDKLGKYRGVPKLRLDPRLIPEDAHFFRLKDWEVVLVVSEQVKATMERAGCVGAKFQEVTCPEELS